MTGAHIVQPAYLQAQDTSEPIGITPKQDPDVTTVLTAHGITTTTPTEKGFLDQVVPTDVAVRSSVLITNGDIIEAFTKEKVAPKWE